jgi:hypothetical protein
MYDSSCLGLLGVQIALGALGLSMSRLGMHALGSTRKTCNYTTYSHLLCFCVFACVSVRTRAGVHVGSTEWHISGTADG